MLANCGLTRSYGGVESFRRVMACHLLAKLPNRPSGTKLNETLNKLYSSQ